MEDPSLVLVDLMIKCTLNLLTRRGREGVSTVDSLVEAVFNGTGIEGNGKRTLDGWRKGAPGKDYPIHNSIPETSFSCAAMVKSGFYGDPEDCQVFHRCDDDRNSGLVKSSFLCPNETMFHKKAGFCDWWFKADCKMKETRTRRSVSQQGCSALCWSVTHHPTSDLPSAEHAHTLKMKIFKKNCPPIEFRASRDVRYAKF